MPYHTLANDSDDLYNADREAVAGPPSPDHRAQSRILRLASICLALAIEQWLLITAVSGILKGILTKHVSTRTLRTFFNRSRWASRHCQLIIFLNCVANSGCTFFNRLKKGGGSLFCICYAVTS